jgi:hypothetical protein
MNTINVNNMGAAHGPTSIQETGAVAKTNGANAADDLKGVNNAANQGVSQLAAPALNAQSPNVSKLAAALEQLFILLAQAAKESRESERKAELSALEQKISSLFAAADKKLENAETTRTQAIVSAVISAVVFAVSIIGSAITMIGAGASMGAGGADAVAGKAAQAIQFGTKAAGDIVNSIGGAVKGAGDSANQWMEADKMVKDAEAEKLRAASEEAAAMMQRSQAVQEDMRELMNRVLELLNTMYAAQNKLAEASAH